MAETVESTVLAPVAAEEIPDKLYFRIGEVARLTGVKQYVLRFWESEFPGLGPKKSGTGHRLYRRKDVEMVLEIKRLLYDKRFTIEGARKWFEQKPKPTAVAKAAPVPKAEKKPQHAPVQHQRGQAELFPEFGGPSKAELDGIRKELQSILQLLH
ncbi:MAG: MerR family transcriptional regulator [Acidobacteria bacterium]|nr:MerR family transcriptional regulator [Acidobacteriota bacterium]